MKIANLIDRKQKMPIVLITLCLILFTLHFTFTPEITSWLMTLSPNSGWLVLFVFASYIPVATLICMLYNHTPGYESSNSLPIKCQALQYSDQMVCTRCEQAWDMNDVSPPKCKGDV